MTATSAAIGRTSKVVRVIIWILYVGACLTIGVLISWEVFLARLTVHEYVIVYTLETGRGVSYLRAMIMRLQLFGGVLFLLGLVMLAACRRNWMRGVLGFAFVVAQGVLACWVSSLAVEMVAVVEG